MISRIIVISLLLLTVHIGGSQTPLRDKMEKIDRADKRRPVLFDDVRRDQLIDLQDTTIIPISESQRTQIFQINNHYDIELVIC